MRVIIPVLTVVLVGGCSGGGHGAAATPRTPRASGSVATVQAVPSSAATASADVTAPHTAVLPFRAVPRITKVLVIVEENHSFAEMRAGMPYLYGLARHYGYATDYRAITHPSLPNYLAIAGGSTLGVSDDEDPSAHRLRGPSVFGQTLAKGGTARLYAEALPSPCARTSTSRFAVRHAPWAYFVDERAACRAGMVSAGTPAAGPLARDLRAGTLPTVGMLVPDLVHDAHDGTLGQADAWLKSWLLRLTAGPDFRSGRLAIVVTADEDDYTKDNRVLTVVLAKGLNRRVVPTPLSHYSLTRFLDEVAGVRPLRLAAKVTSLGRAFGLKP